MTRSLPPYRSFLASDSKIREVLRTHRTIAFVGISADPAHSSRTTATFLKQHGYQVIPVHQSEEDIMGIPPARSLRSLVDAVDLILFWPTTEDIERQMHDAVALNVSTVWLETGMCDAAVAYQFSREGFTVILDRNIQTEYEMYFPDNASDRPSEEDV